MTIQGGCVYIIANRHHTVFYVGVAASISNRIQQHREKFYPKSFSAKYNIGKLVYYEFFDAIVDAIDREKKIKKYSRFKKVQLIKTINPDFRDLAEEVQYM